MSLAGFSAEALSAPGEDEKDLNVAVSRSGAAESTVTSVLLIESDEP